ncbi:MAG: DUF881 domain-containing protein [Euzebyales bacterium]|nr:DUF881 domain-containing protein [Euzebyales bacterium]
MRDPAEVLGLTPEEDDYRPPPPRRWSQPLASPLVVVLVALGALAVGYAVTAGTLAGREVARVQDERRDELVALITARQERLDGLEAQADALRGRVASAEDAAAAPGLRSAVTRSEQGAGLTALRGPGVVVTFDDATTCRAEQPQDCRILDVDLQLAVNTLFAEGAEAVAINGERLIATSAIRGAGLSVLVNYRVLAPPYELAAVGDPESLEAGFRSSRIGQDFIVWQDAYGLGYEVQRADDLALPAFTGSVRLRSAVVADDSEAVIR